MITSANDDYMQNLSWQSLPFSAICRSAIERAYARRLLYISRCGIGHMLMMNSRCAPDFLSGIICCCDVRLLKSFTISPQGYFGRQRRSYARASARAYGRLDIEWPLA